LTVGNKVFAANGSLDASEKGNVGMKHVKTMTKKPARAIITVPIIGGLLDILAFWTTKYARTAQGDIQDVYN